MKQLFVCGSFFMSLAVASALAGVDSQSYVRSDLIMQYDAIDNAGVGRHDASATVWKDISGNGRDGTLTGSCVWNDESLTINGKSESGRVSFNGYMGRTHTIEGSMAYLNSNSGGGYISSLDIYVSSYIFHMGGYGFNFIQPGIKCLNDSRFTFTICHTGEIVGPLVVYSNGVLRSSRATSAIKTGASPTYLGGKASNNGLDGNFSSYRMYNRVLTADEVLFNALVDRVRFDHEEGATLDWPDGAKWEDDRLMVRIAVGGVDGAVVAGGGAQGETLNVWAEIGTTQTVTLVTAPSGKTLQNWYGDLAYHSSSTQAQVVAVYGAVARPRFADAASASSNKVFDELLVKDGLVARFDASVADSLETNSDGRVLKWSACEYGPLCNSLAFTNATADLAPTYVKDMFYKGLPAVCLGMNFVDNGDGTVTTNVASTLFQANTSIGYRTIFVVERMMNGTTYTRLWSDDCNWVFGSDTTWTVHCWSNKGLGPTGGLMFFNGTCVSTPLSASDNGIAFAAGIFNEVGTSILKSSMSLCYRMKSRLSGFVRLGLPNIRSDAHSAFRGGVGEVIIYDRELNPAEIRAVSEYLNNKWRGASMPWTDLWQNTIWTGAGDGTSWTDADNWSAGVPTAKSSVRIANATVNVSGLAPIENLRLDNATVTLAEDAELSVSRFFCVRGNSKAELAVRSKLVVAEDVTQGNDAFAVSLDGGTFVLAPRSMMEMHHNKYVVARREEMSDRPLTINLTGSGKFIKAGAGTLRLNRAIPATVAVEVAGGWLDLCGRDLTVAGLSGLGYLENSAANVPTVTVDTDENCELGGVSLQRINVVKKGAGAATLRGGLVAGGKLTVEEGALTVPELLPPASIPGMVVHLDASRSETLITNAEGRVTEWMNAGGVAERFVLNPSNQTWLPPFYGATAFDGKPGIMFSINADATKGGAETNMLAAMTMVTNRTTILVVKPVAKMTTCADFYYGGSDGWYISIDHEAGHTQQWSLPLASGSRAYINGAKIYDSVEGITDAKFRMYTYGKAQVVAVTRPASNLEAANCFRPVLGGREDVYSVRRAGAVFAEVIAYESELSDSEVKRLSSSLMKKWGITYDNVTITGETYAVESPQLTAAELSLAGEAQVDLDAGAFALNKLTVAGQATVTNGSLTVGAIEVPLTDTGAHGLINGNADWDLADATLTFIGERSPAMGKIIRTSGSLTGDLSEITPAKRASRVRVTSNSLGIVGGSMIILR